MLFSEALDEDEDVKSDARHMVAKAAVKWMQILNKVGHVDEEIPNQTKPIV